MGAAVEEPTADIAEDVLDAAVDVFEAWEQRLAGSMIHEGYEAEAASDYASIIVAGVEGAIVQCRARRSIDRFDRLSRRWEGMIARSGSPRMK